MAGKNQNGDLDTEDLDGVLLVACGIPRTWGHKGQIEGLRVRGAWLPQTVECATRSQGCGFKPHIGC